MNWPDFEGRGFNVNVARRSDVKNIREPVCPERLEGF